MRMKPFHRLGQLRSPSNSSWGKRIRRRNGSAMVSVLYYAMKKVRGTLLECLEANGILPHSPFAQLFQDTGYREWHRRSTSSSWTKYLVLWMKVLEKNC